MKKNFPLNKFLWAILATLLFTGCLYVFFQNTKSRVPKLSQVVLSSEETGISQLPDFYEVEKTNELGDFCKIDCVRVSYISKMVNLSITLIKSETPYEASQVLQDFRETIENSYLHNLTSNSLHTNYFEEFTPSKFEPLLLSDSWGIIHKSSGEFFVYNTIMVTYGEIVVIVSKGVEACWNVEEELVCDYEFEAQPRNTSLIAVAQIKKLQESGYKNQLP